MGSSKDFNRYTERWRDLFHLFQEDPSKEHIVHCKSPQEARLVRLEFYKAREALHRAEEHDRLHDHVAYAEYGHPNLDRKEVRVVGNDVIFGFKDSSRIALLLAESLVDPMNNPQEAQHGQPE